TEGKAVDLISDVSGAGESVVIGPENVETGIVVPDYPQADAQAGAPVPKGDAVQRGNVSPATGEAREAVINSCASAILLRGPAETALCSGDRSKVGDGDLSGVGSRII